MTEKSSNKLPSQRERILTIAARLFAEKGYHAVSMRDLCDEAGLGRGAIYYHIKSKEDLLYDISRNYMQELIDEGLLILDQYSSPVQRVEHLGHSLIKKISERQTQLTVCFREVRSLTEHRLTEVMGLHKKYEEIWGHTLREGAKNGIFCAYKSILLKSILGMYFYSYVWKKPKGRLTAEIIANHFNEAALRILCYQGQ